MAEAVLKRVVIDNYKIFSHRQELDFRRNPLSTTKSKYFTLVGENGSGKSTFLALVGLASNFAGKITHHICNHAKESVVACEYEIENWTELTNMQSNIRLHNYPSFELWFLTGVFKIPSELYRFIAERYLGLNTKDLKVVIGFKHSPPSEMNEGVVSKFLYVQYGSNTVALMQEFHNEALVAIVNSSDVDDLLHWMPDPSILTPTGCNFIGDLTPIYNKDNPMEYLDSKNPQAALILILRNMLAAEFRDTIWADIIDLFHELTGNTKITVIFDSLSGCVRMRQQFGGCEVIRDDLPNGFFHAFIIAFLIVNPSMKTILLDEPTLGMHPLQIRRLQRILSQKSLQEGKVIIVATHAPDMVHTSQIDHIFRFQGLDSGFVEVRRTSVKHDNRDIRFIGSVESRELFFTRRIIWVEGDTDRRFCEAMLKLIDEGNRVLWSVLMDPQEVSTGASLVGSSMIVEDMDSDSSTDEVDYGNIGINPLDNLFQTSDYERKYFKAKVLAECQELARSCSVLPLSGKKNIDKATRTCKDLGIPYAVICDLDAILPNSKKNSIMSQFMKCIGKWNLASVDKKLLLDGEQSPASTCIEDPTLKAQLKKCHNAQEVIHFYETMERIFAWRVGNGEIEDLVKVTKSTFSKKWWADFTAEAFLDLILFMLVPNVENATTAYGKHSNPELLRCLYFVLEFLLAVH